MGKTLKVVKNEKVEKVDFSKALSISLLIDNAEGNLQVLYENLGKVILEAIKEGLVKSGREFSRLSGINTAKVSRAVQAAKGIDLKDKNLESNSKKVKTVAGAMVKVIDRIGAHIPAVTLEQKIKAVKALMLEIKKANPVKYAGLVESFL